MRLILNVELWGIAGAAAIVAVAVLLIRVGWRRGKALEDR
jgi:hypothetical protein